MEQNPGKANLISWWKFDETSGTRYDAHGTNHLTDVNTVLYQLGKIGNAADFESANNEYLEIADNPSLSFGDENMTIGVWVKLESFASNSQILGKWEVDKHEYRIDITVTTGIPRFMVRGGATEHIVSWGAGLSLATWYFVTAWHDSVNDLIGICVNNGTPVTVAHSTGISDNSSVFRSGALSSGSGNYDGLIDEAFLYRRLLTADERTWLYNGGSGRTYEELEVIGVAGVFLSDYGVM